MRLLSAILTILFLAASGAIASSEDRTHFSTKNSEALFIEAQKALARGDFDSAERSLIGAFSQDTTFFAAAFQLAQIYESKGSLHKAREFLMRGLAIDPTSSWARKKLAQLEAQEPQANLQSSKPTIKSREQESPKENAATKENGKAAFTEKFETSNANGIRKGESQTAKAKPIPETESERTESADSSLLKASVRTFSEQKPSTPANYESKKTSLAEEKRTIEIPSFLYLLSALAAGTTLLWYRNRARKSTEAFPLQGSIAVTPLLDVVSLLASNVRSGVLSIESPDCSGKIFIERGNIVHAVCEALLAKEAFSHMIKLRSGRFSFNNHLPPVKRTITEPLGNLILLASKEETEGAVKESNVSLRSNATRARVTN